MNATKERTGIDDFLAEMQNARDANIDYPIWPAGKKLEVIGLTGDEGSGKTLFACSIDPTRTLVYGFEKGASEYEHLGITHIDVRDELLKLKPDGYTPLQMFRWLEQDLRKIEPGKFSVIVIDTIGDPETGLADFVAAKHKEFGFQSADSFRSTGGIFWSYVSAYWKYLLADLSTRCQSFAYTSHLRAIWKNGKSTPDKEPQGKRVLRQLSSLCLWLTREPNSEKPPTAQIHNNKARLCVSDYVKGRLVHYPCLPPNMPECTPDTLREYILDPVGKRKLRKSEKIEVSDGSLTEDQRLEMQAEIAADQRAAQEAKLAAAQAIGSRKAAAVRVEPDQTGPNRTKPDHEKPAENEQKPKPEPKPEPKPDQTGFKPDSQSNKLSSDQLAELAGLKKSLRFDKAAWQSLLSSYGVDGARDLSPDNAKSIIKVLKKQFKAESEAAEAEPAAKSPEEEWVDGALPAKN